MASSFEGSSKISTFSPKLVLRKSSSIVIDGKSRGGLRSEMPDAIFVEQKMIVIRISTDFSEDWSRLGIKRDVLATGPKAPPGYSWVEFELLVA